HENQAATATKRAQSRNRRSRALCAADEIERQVGAAPRLLTEARRVGVRIARKTDRSDPRARDLGNVAQSLSIAARRHDPRRARRARPPRPWRGREPPRRNRLPPPRRGRPPPPGQGPRRENPRRRARRISPEPRAAPPERRRAPRAG